MVLVCHVILQDSVNKVSCDFISRSPSRQVTILTSSYVARGLVIVEIYIFVISQDHSIKGASDFIGEGPSW